MSWIRRKQLPGTIGVGFYDGGATLAWLQPSAATASPALAACDTLRGADNPALAAPLRAWVDKQGAKGARCVAVLEPGSYQMLQLEPPQVAEDELRTAIRWRVRDLISFPLEQAVVEIFAPPENVRKRVRNINVVIARESVLRERIELLESAGLRLDVIDIGSLAQRNIAAALPHNEHGVALLALDADSGLITLVKNDEIYLSRDLDFGLDALPSDSQAPSEDPAFERITLELQRSLDYYESALGQSPLTRVVVHPAGTRVAGLLAYLKQNFFQLQIHELALDDLLEYDPEQAEAAAALPACLQAVGAAMRAESTP